MKRANSTSSLAKQEKPEKRARVEECSAEYEPESEEIDWSKPLDAPPLPFDPAFCTILVGIDKHEEGTSHMPPYCAYWDSRLCQDEEAAKHIKKAIKKPGEFVDDLAYLVQGDYDDPDNVTPLLLKFLVGKLGMCELHFPRVVVNLAGDA